MYLKKKSQTKESDFLGPRFDSCSLHQFVLDKQINYWFIVSTIIVVLSDVLSETTTVVSVVFTTSVVLFDVQDAIKIVIAKIANAFFIIFNFSFNSI